MPSTHLVKSFLQTAYRQNLWFVVILFAVDCSRMPPVLDLLSSAGRRIALVGSNTDCWTLILGRGLHGLPAVDMQLSRKAVSISAESTSSFLRAINIGQGRVSWAKSLEGVQTDLLPKNLSSKQPVDVEQDVIASSEKEELEKEGVLLSAGMVLFLHGTQKQYAFAIVTHNDESSECKAFLAAVAASKLGLASSTSTIVPTSLTSSPSVQNLKRKLDISGVGSSSSSSSSPPSYKFLSAEMRELARSKHNGGWQDALTPYINIDSSSSQPDLKRFVYWQNSDVVVIYDAYPKARFHLLIIPKKKISSLTSLTANDISLVTKMHGVADWIADGLVHQEQEKSGKLLKFRSGYHSVPSMNQLHLHLISMDMNSEWLKNKKHWISFTNDSFFLSRCSVMRQLETNGNVSVNKQMCEDLFNVKGPLSCYLCQEQAKNLPALKMHVEPCLQNNLKKNAGSPSITN